MPRASGSRTGQKHKKRRVVKGAAESTPCHGDIASDEGASAEPKPIVSASEDDEFKTFQSVSRIIDDLIAHLEKDERKIQFDRDWHAMHKANAIACAEAYKRRSALNPLSCEEACEPFRLAWQQALREWETAYKADLCSACSEQRSNDCHLARCMCYIDCSGCGQRVPARPWRVGWLSCRCEKISSIAGQLFGSGRCSGSDLGLF